jgi:Tfp pilus assembly protein PilO
MPLGLRPLEIVVAVMLIFLVILVAYYYVSTLQPEQERLTALEKRDAELDKLLQEAKLKNEQPPQQDAAQMALDSLNAFKEKRLKPQMRGEIALYKDINALAKKYNLQLMSGIEMGRQGEGKEQEEGKVLKKGEALLRVYPETNIQFTVAGEYQSIRNFISELEQNPQFLIINSLNLITVENEDGGGGGGGRRGGRGGRGGTTQAIGLSISMTTYFHP